MVKSKSSRAWMREHVSDQFVKRAEREGLRSRAAFKLQQINERDRLLKPGMCVVDLGAAPGGWSQLAARAVQPGGRIFAIDLQDMAPLPGVVFLKGDFCEDEALRNLEIMLEQRSLDLVLSDMSPNISGVRATDQARWEHLAELAMDFACSHLKPGGDFLVKCFQGAGTDELRRRLALNFDSVVVRKPEASRDRSREFFLLARGRRKSGAGSP